MIKVLVSIDERLLARLDREAKRAGLSRSAFIAGLAARALDARQGPGRRPQSRRALDRLERLFDGQEIREDATLAVRRERDAR